MRESTSSSKLKAKDDTSLLTFHQMHAKTKQGKRELLEKKSVLKSFGRWMTSFYNIGLWRYNRSSLV